MNKEEILAKSRKENKNRDIAGMDINKNASRISLIFSLFFIMFLMTLTWIAGKHMNHGIIATEYSMIFLLFLYKAIKTKRKPQKVPITPTANRYETRDSDDCCYDTSNDDFTLCRHDSGT